MQSITITCHFWSVQSIAITQIRAMDCNRSRLTITPCLVTDLLNWRINVVIIVNSTQLSLKLSWIVNNCVWGPLFSLCWLNRTHFWNLLSELLVTLRLAEMRYFHKRLSIHFASTFYKEQSTLAGKKQES